MFTFAWPYAFLLLPLLWIFVRLRPLKQKQNESMLRVPHLDRVTALNQTIQASGSSRFFQRLRVALIWVLLVIACANPQWLGEPLPIMQNGRNIMLAIDLSQSMEIPDLQRDNQTINRLDTVKEVAANFIEKRQGDKLGLILFGSKAYLQTPLTFDRKTVRNMLDDATIGLAGQRTAIGDAVALGVKKFTRENIKSRVLILLTDGGNNSGDIDPIQAAELAKDHQIKIYTVGIGASQMLINGVFGSQTINPSIDLDEGLLKNIAKITGGQYFRAQDDKTLASILDAINQLEPISTENKTARPITALFYWPLAAALLMLSLFIFPNISLRRQ